MSCILDGQPDILFSGEFYARLYVSDSRDIDGVAGIVPKLTRLFLSRKGITGLVLEIRHEELGRFLDAAQQLVSEWSLRQLSMRTCMTYWTGAKGQASWRP